MYQKKTKLMSFKKISFTLQFFLCTVKKFSCTLVCTVALHEDHCFNVLFLIKPNLFNIVFVFICIQCFLAYLFFAYLSGYSREVDFLSSTKIN